MTDLDKAQRRVAELENAIGAISAQQAEHLAGWIAKSGYTTHFRSPETKNIVHDLREYSRRVAAIAGVV